ncbi:MAG: MarR family transcriptional regulator [Clostridiales bacterium]|nr:MarR family transcriptional regulator [Clostridiales bacterium]
MQNHELITNIFTLFPTMMKKLMGQASFPEMPKQQFMLLHSICYHDNMPMNFYSERLHVSKPNLTVLADKLIDAGYAQRGTMPEDRRQIALRVTPSGREYMDKVWDGMTESISKKFEKIDTGTLERLNALVIEMSEIINKFDNLPED